ncbi:hypothetical protein [Ornithinibacillus californiensis]|uniref:hypothetical protein n=1 Tax=Ornithinibacillus californiensis TaxID=161536 RepID=UPI00064DBE61|nr:hypothetical protein [Ornithinibacillus californiensis]
MKIRLLIGFTVFLLLVACSPEEDKEDQLLSSNVQYIGDNNLFLSSLESLEIDFENLSTINLNLPDNKLVLIEPSYIPHISRELIITALKEGYYVFFINLDDSRIIQEAYFGVIPYDIANKDKIWTEHLYLKDGQLQSVTIPTDPVIEQNLLEWLQYFDNHKLPM